jgi:hypothetical protein
LRSDRNRVFASIVTSIKFDGEDEFSEKKQFVHTMSKNRTTINIHGKFDFTGLKAADLNINVGAGELRLDFREPNAEQADIRINSGAATTTATGLCNANFRRLDFDIKMGVGAWIEGVR